MMPLHHNNNQEKISTARSRRRTVKWNLFFGYLSMALGIVSSLVLIPLYLKFIPVGLYGAWLATGNILVWITTMDPGLSTLLLQRVGTSYGKGDFRSLIEFITAGILLSAGISLMILILGFAVGSRISILLKLPPEIDVKTLTESFYIAVVGCSAMIFSYSIWAVCRGLQGSLIIGLTDCFARILGIILVVVLLFNGYGLFAIAVAPLFSSIVIIFGLSVYLIWRVSSERMGFFLSVRKIPELFKLMSFTFFGRAASVIANNMDLFAVSRFLGPEMVPLLHITRRGPQMVTGFLDKPASAFSPVISHLIGSGERAKASEVLLRFIRILVWVLGLVLGGFIAFNDDFIRLWVGSEFYAGNAINTMICANMLLMSFISCFTIFCVAMGNIKGSSLASMAEGLLFIPLIIVGTKYFGLYGAVLAPLIAKTATTAWYFPSAFSRLLRLARRQILQILIEILKVACVMVFLTAGFLWVFPSGWPSFVLSISTYSLFYTIALYLLSKDVRLEFREIYMRGANKVRSYLYERA